MIRPIGFEISDLIQVWIGLAVSLSAIFAWLTYRIAKGGFFMSLPHVDVRASSSGPQRNFAWIRLLGPNTEQWKIAKVSIVSPRAVHFVRRIDTQDDHGGGSWSAGEALGRTQDSPSNPIILSSLDVPVKLRIKLSLRARPSVTSLRTTIISIND